MYNDLYCDSVETAEESNKTGDILKAEESNMYGDILKAANNMEEKISKGNLQCIKIMKCLE